MVHEFRSNKTLDGSEPQKRIVFRIGPQEFKVLDHLLRNNYIYFQIKIIANALDIDHHRAWSIVNRLVRRGIVYRVDRGLYILDRDKAAILISMKRSIRSINLNKDSMN